MNGDVNTWERGGGANAVYDKDGTYLGFTSSDGSWWPTIPGTSKNGMGGPSKNPPGGETPQDAIDAAKKNSPLGSFLGDMIFGNKGSFVPGSGVADWASGFLKTGVIVIIGIILLFVGAFSLMKSEK